MPRGVAYVLNRDEVLEAAEACQGNISAMARHMGIGNDSTLRRFVANDPGLFSEVAACKPHLGGRKTKPNGKMLADKPGLCVKGDEATLTTNPAPDLGDLDTLIRERGLDPDDWDVKNAILNEWDSNAGDGEIIKLRQLKVNLVRKVPLEFVFPAMDVKQRVIKPGKPKAGGRLVACLADQHAPYHDEALNERVLSMLAKIEPDEIVNLGDVGDYPDISKHRDNPAWSASAQESVQASYNLLSAQRDTCAASKIVLLKGNHDWRLETELLARAERMYGIKPADIVGEGPQRAANSLYNYLHLERLGIELIEPELAAHEED